MVRPTPLERWLSGSRPQSFMAVWSEDGADTGVLDADGAFDAFYAAIMRHHRVDPGESLRALSLLSPEDRRGLSSLNRRRLDRLHGHVLAVTGDYRGADASYRRAWNAFVDHRQKTEAVATGIGWINVLSQLSAYDEAERIGKQCRKYLDPADRLRRARLDSNLGNVLLLSGDFDGAAGRYRSARTIFRGAGYLHDAALSGYNLGYAHISAGRVGRGRRYLSEASDHFAQHELTAQHLHARAALGFAALMEGDSGALDQLSALLDDLGKSGDRRALAVIQRQQAEYLSAVGIQDRAASLADDAVRLYRDLGLRSDAAETSGLHGRIFSRLGRHLDARVRLEQSLEFWKAGKNRTARRVTELDLALVLLARDDAVSALKLLRPVLTDLDRSAGKAAASRARHAMALAYLATGRAGLASRLARRAYEDADRYPVRFLRPWMALTLAEAMALGRRTADAARWARVAVNQMERLTTALGTRSLRGEQSMSRESLYRRAVELVLGTGGPRSARTALDLLSRARSPQLIEDLLFGGTPLQSSLRSAIARLRDTLLEDEKEGGGFEDVRSVHLQDRIQQLDAELAARPARGSAAVRRALEERAFAKWSKRLGKRTLVLYDRTSEGWGAYVARGGAVRRQHLPEAARALENTWLPLRLLLEQAAHYPSRRRARFLRETLAEAEDAMAALTRDLWQPLGVDAAEILVVPNNEMNGVPLEALSFFDSHPPSAITRLPHPALAGRLGSGTTKRGALLLHDGGAGTRREVEAVSRILSEEGFRIETADSRERVEALSRPVGLLHVAAHGAYHRDRWMLNGIRLKDGWMGFEQLRAANIKGALLFFSSCDSGLSGRYPGWDLDGWMTAGIAAGARELVLTLWKLDDDSGDRFAQSFYREWARGTQLNRAVVNARLAARKAQPHPFAWAPHVALG